MPKNRAPKEDEVEIVEDTPVEETNENEASVILKRLTNEQLIQLALDQQQAIVDNQAKILELTSLCKRVQADFDNYRKRNIENISKARQDAAVEVIEKFIPLLDVLDHAITLIKDEQVLSGIKMMSKQLSEVFIANGVHEIEALDQDFDPNLHEAVMSEENKEKSGKVLEVFRKGYRMGDKIIRYVSVKVAN